MIIDAHSHWLPQEIIDNAHFFSKVWGDIEAHVAAMDKAGVDKVVLSYPTSDAHIRMGSLEKVVEIYNERVAAILKIQPERFIGAAILPVNSVSVTPGNSDVTLMPRSRISQNRPLPHFLNAHFKDV